MKKIKVFSLLLVLYAVLVYCESSRIGSVWQDLGLESAAFAEISEPTRSDEYISMAVCALLQESHISEHDLDEEIAHRMVSGFLKSLDPQKLYFYRQDVDTIQGFEKQVPGWLRKGNVNLAYVIFKTYLNRLDERVAMMEAALDQPMDFTLDETMKIKPEVLDYPKTRAEAEERVRLRVKYDMLLLQVDDQKAAKKKANTEEAASEGTENGAADAQNTETAGTAEETPKTPEEKLQANREKLRKRYSSFRKRMHQMDGEELLEFYLTSMTNSYDPHSSYMSPSTLENFNISMSLELQGIGATLTSEDGYVTVKRLVPGGPAEKEGSLKINDKICGVAQGDDGTMEDVVDMKLDEVVKKIRGKADTVVRLEVIPADGSATKVVRIVRSKIELKDSEAKGVVFEAGKKADGTPYKIGVINLPSFYLDMQANHLFGKGKSSTQDVKRILEDFNAQGVDAVVLDLRNNGGGSLQESISLTGLFIDLGCVVQVKDSAGKSRAYRDFTSGVTWNGPLVVVINKLSASASEILAGAIQDYGRGLVIGDKTTHGKGTVQTVEYLSRRLLGTDSPKLGALKVTIQQFYRPLGDSTQNRGVASDIEIPSITTHMDIGESDLDYSLEFDQIEAQEIEKWAAGPDRKMIQRLAARSAERVKANEEFGKLAKKIDFYCRIKDREEVTLNLEKFMEERADVLTDEEEELEEALTDEANEIERDFYMDEVLNIMTDYIGELEKAGK
ncbi:MAG: carboxy terminal-processing peptidase [Thermoguttaceae bacterium]|nr:carboxy terminal-processing peptidase [Thermoguttaceae bacterium]